MKVPVTLLRACGRGNVCACSTAKRISAIFAGSVIKFSEVKANDKHANKLPFKGILLIADEPSDKPPHGAQGHRILVRGNVIDQKLSGLIGMGVNYDPSDMDEHQTSHKVGVITKAWRDGKNVWTEGFVWRKDFPEAERDLKQKNLGQSMELANVFVKNEHSPVWELNDFEFTGATILKKNAAAYTSTSLSASKDKNGRDHIGINEFDKKRILQSVETSLAASAKAAVLGEEGANRMKKNAEDKKKRKVAAAESNRNSSGDLALMTQAISGSFTNALGPLVSEIKASNQAVLDSVEELKGLHLIQAAAQPAEDEDEVVLHAAKEDDSDDMAAASDSDDMAAASDSDDEVEAAKSDDEDDADESSDDDSSQDEMEAMEDLGLEDASEEPGEINKDATSKGSKTTVTKPPKQGEHFSGNVAKGRLHSAAKKGAGMKKPFPGLEAAAVQLRTVHATNRKLKRTINAMEEKYGKKIRKLQAAYQAQEERLEFFTDREARRSVMPTELVNLAAKSGVNLGELKASGQEMNPSQVDHMFAIAKSQGIEIAPEQRIAMKNLLEAEGLMSNGEIVRNYGRA